MSGVSDCPEILRAYSRLCAGAEPGERKACELIAEGVAKLPPLPVAPEN